MKRFRLGHLLKTSLWFLPLMCVVAGVLLSLLMTAVDDGTIVGQSITGDSTAALQVLYLIAFSMLTLTGLVLSLVIVVVQLSMGVFSPRIVRQILHDRPSQLAIGLFAGTFAYTLLVMRHVRSDSSQFVPGLAVVIALVLALMCIGTLIWYVNHIGQALRVAALVGWVAKDTSATIEQVYPDPGPDPEDDPGVITAVRPGVVFKVDHERLLGLATRADCTLELLWTIGDYVPTDAPLLRITGNLDHRGRRKAAGYVALGPERTMNQDVAYGIRMLVDIAEGSVASGPFVDPTTAVQAIDRLHDLMRQLVRRPLGSGLYHDESGRLRLVVPTMTWEGYVRLAFEEIRQAGSASPQVTRRLRAALDDLLVIAPADRRAPLELQLELLQVLAAQSSQSEADRRAATVPDPVGIGSAAGLVSPTRVDDVH